MSTISRVDFEKMVSLCRAYDAYTWYIDDFNQMKKAETRNAELEQEFNEIANIYFDGYDGGIRWVKVCMDSTNSSIEAVLGRWIIDRGCEVESITTVKAKRVWTEQEIKNLVQTNDTVLYNALKKLYACQTADEKRDGETKENNGVGFNGADASFLSSTAEFLKKTGFLTEKQKVIVRRKLVKYNKQLTRLANA